MYISKTFQKNVIAFSEQIKMEFIFLERQFERVKEGDRFFFTHKDEAGSFTTAAKEIFLGRTLSGVICHSSWQWLLGPKKSSSKSTNIGPKVHIVTTWETIEKLKNNTPLGDSS